MSPSTPRVYYYNVLNVMDSLYPLRNKLILKCNRSVVNHRKETKPTEKNKNKEKKQDPKIRRRKERQERTTSDIVEYCTSLRTSSPAQRTGIALF